MCVRTALWRAPSFSARFMSPGAHGAPAQPPVDTARWQGHVFARTRRAALPVLTPRRGRAAICHHVQVCTHTNSTQCWKGTCKLSVSSVLHLCPTSLSLSPAGCLLNEWSSWTECSATCGGGLTVRNKTVLREPEPGGAACVGPVEQHTVCNTNSCLPGKHTHTEYISTK